MCACDRQYRVLSLPPKLDFIMMRDLFRSFDSYGRKKADCFVLVYAKEFFELVYFLNTIPEEKNLALTAQGYICRRAGGRMALR